MTPQTPNPNRPASPRPDAPEARELSPLERAELRAAELREHGNNDIDDTVDEFYINPNMIPEGWVYEWKRRSVLGFEDPSDQVNLQRRGWEPVPKSRHPELMPAGYTGNEVLRKGLVLMERPKVISQEARDRELQKARAQVRTKEEQLTTAPPGQLQRHDSTGKSLVAVKKGYEAIPIADS